MVFGLKRMFRRFVRQNTNPIPMTTAEAWRFRLSLLYMFIGWNAFGFVLYYMFTGREDWAHYYGLKTEEERKERPAEYYADLLGLKNVRIITVEGFQKVKDYEYSGEDAETEKNEKEKGKKAQGVESNVHVINKPQ